MLPNTSFTLLIFLTSAIWSFVGANRNISFAFQKSRKPNDSLQVKHYSPNGLKPRDYRPFNSKANLLLHEYNPDPPYPAINKPIDHELTENYQPSQPVNFITRIDPVFYNQSASETSYDVSTKYHPTDDQPTIGDVFNNRPFKALFKKYDNNNFPLATINLKDSDEDSSEESSEEEITSLTIDGANMEEMRGLLNSLMTSSSINQDQYHQLDQFLQSCSQDNITCSSNDTIEIGWNALENTQKEKIDLLNHQIDKLKTTNAMWEDRNRNITYELLKAKGKHENMVLHFVTQKRKLKNLSSTVNQLKHRCKKTTPSPVDVLTPKYLEELHKLRQEIELKDQKIKNLENEKHALTLKLELFGVWNSSSCREEKEMNSGQSGISNLTACMRNRSASSNMEFINNVRLEPLTILEAICEGVHPEARETPTIDFSPFPTNVTNALLNWSTNFLTIILEGREVINVILNSDLDLEPYYTGSRPLDSLLRLLVLIEESATNSTHGLASCQSLVPALLEVIVLHRNGTNATHYQTREDLLEKEFGEGLEFIMDIFMETLSAIFDSIAIDQGETK